MTPFRRTRLAPTPSGYLHAGNIYSFQLTAGLAKKSNSRLLLRIDDLDIQRARPEYIENIFATLSELGIEYDEGPRNAKEFAKEYSQVHRKPMYDAALLALREAGSVFACECSRAQLAVAGGAGCVGGCREKKLPLDGQINWRLRTDDETPVEMLDEDGTATEYRLPANMHEFVVRKRDGMASYQLASLVDDDFYEVDFVVRGNDLRDSTVAQLYLARVLGMDSFLQTRFLHHALVLDAEGKKLSKSAGGSQR